MFNKEQKRFIKAWKQFLFIKKGMKTSLKMDVLRVDLFRLGLSMNINHEELLMFEKRA